jgi:hypothetical protein
MQNVGGGGRLISYRRGTVLKSFFSFEVRNKNVHE